MFEWFPRPVWGAFCGFDERFQVEAGSISDGLRHLGRREDGTRAQRPIYEYAFLELGIKLKLPGSSIQHLISDPTRSVVAKRKA